VIIALNVKSIGVMMEVMLGVLFGRTVCLFVFFTLTQPFLVPPGVFHHYQNSMQTASEQ